MLKSMHQTAAEQFCQLLRDIADDIEAESEPLEEYRHDEVPEGFEAIWQDR